VAAVHQRSVERVVPDVMTVRTMPLSIIGKCDQSAEET